MEHAELKMFKAQVKIQWKDSKLKKIITLIALMLEIHYTKKKKEETRRNTD